MKTRPSRSRSPAFTRLELAASLGAATLLALAAIPPLAVGGTRTDRVICANNLRQVGLAFQLWSHDHEDLPVFEVPTNAGGTRLHILAPNAWLHFSWMSNELASPQWLFCPSDTGRPARDFTGDPGGGYIHPNFANRATSYFLAHFSISTPGAVIAGDRNVGYETPPISCARFANAVGVPLRPVPSPFFRWTNGLHEASGNVLHLDGSVEQLSNAGLARTVVDAQADNGNLHFITPR